MRYLQNQLIGDGKDEVLGCNDENSELVKFWVLRGLLFEKSYVSFYEDNEYLRSKISDNILNFLKTPKKGFASKLDGNDKLEKSYKHYQFKQMYKKLKGRKSIENVGILDENIEKLSSVLSLNETQKWILTFFLLAKKYRALDDVLTEIEVTTYGNFVDILSMFLMIDKNEINNELQEDSILIRCGLIEIDFDNNTTMDRVIRIENNFFMDKMFKTSENITDIFKDRFKATEPTTLRADDFAHISKQHEIFVSYLKSAKQTKKRGCNILLYGEPGTGKTEYAKLLAKEINSEIYEISYADDDNDSQNGSSRFSACITADEVLKDTNSVLLFDEMEDVIISPLFSPRPISKAHFNRTLEQNHLPIIWISNSIFGLDNAYLRRFDIVYEMPNPTRKKRSEMTKGIFKNSIEEKLVENIASHDKITPAIMTRTCEVLDSIKDDVADTSEATSMILNETLKAQGYAKIPTNSSSYVSTYDSAFVNTDVDLQEVLRGIKQTENARICLFGKPGTGKSEYCKYIAHELDKPILIKKASDILSPFVGVTEKNIARAFEEAKRDGAVLVFDEVDTFLQDRRGASQSWEISQVNEMLTQMESYDGIFFATTNLSENLDAAALRRFDMKLEFGYLNENQSLELLKKHLKELGLSGLCDADKKRLKSLKNLALGDFNAIRRQMRFYPVKSVDEMLLLLEKECELKEDVGNGTMGFLNG